jgi:hypothetical protein
MGKNTKTPPTYQFKINTKIEDVTKENYFWLSADRKFMIDRIPTRLHL